MTGYDGLTIYNGPNVACANCKRKFTPGEVISQAAGQDLIFCYSDAFGGCVSAYVFSTGEMMTGETVRYRDAVLPDEQQTPNYPNTPIIQPLTREGSSLFQRVREYLREYFN